jgi:hypothetical protein
MTAISLEWIEYSAFDPGGVLPVGGNGQLHTKQYFNGPLKKHLNNTIVTMALILVRNFKVLNIFEHKKPPLWKALAVRSVKSYALSVDLVLP